MCTATYAISLPSKASPSCEWKLLLQMHSWHCYFFGLLIISGLLLVCCTSLILLFFLWKYERNLKSKMWFQDNNIIFWRNFVGKYFATNAKKRWCVSLYGSGGRQPTGIFPQVCFVISLFISVHCDCPRRNLVLSNEPFV